MKAVFCPNCKSVMRISGSGAVCSSCGYEKVLEENEKKHSEKMEKKQNIPIKVKKKFLGLNATYPHKCSKCGYEKAEMIMSEPWYSDADYNIRFKCGKCGHVERERLVKT